MFKIGIVAAFITAAAAQYNQHSYEQHHELYTHPKYEFKYGIDDHHTGDHKSQFEIRDGDVTKGEYSLVEPDGTLRKIEYSVDKHSGFNAVVTRTGHGAHPTGHVAHHAAPAVHAVQYTIPAVEVHHAVPVVHHAPIVHHAPVLALHHAAPTHSHEHGHATSYASIVSHHEPSHHAHH